MSILLNNSDAFKEACSKINQCYSTPELKIRTQEALEELNSDERACLLEAIKMTKNPSITPVFSFEANQLLNHKLLTIANQIEALDDEGEPAPLHNIKDFGWSEWELSAINAWRAVKTFFGFRVSVDTLIQKINKHSLPEDVNYSYPQNSTFTDACKEISACYADENLRTRTEEALEDLTSEDRECLIELIKMTNKPLMVPEFATEVKISALSNKLRASALAIKAKDVEEKLVPIPAYKDSELEPWEKTAMDTWRMIKTFLGFRISTDRVISKINKFSFLHNTQ